MSNNTPLSLVIANLEDRIEAVSLRKKGLILHLNELSSYPLEIEFLPGHPNHGSITSLFLEKHKTVIDIANIVMATLVERSRTSLAPNINLFINNSVANTELVIECIRETTAALHCAQITSYTLECILALIKVHNCDRESAHLSELLWRRNRAASVYKKVLNIVVTCRTVSCTDGSCGICFDEMKEDNIVKTGCNHDFCADCMIGWAKQRGIKSFIQCPCCRAEIGEMTVGTQEEKVKLEKGLR